MIPSDPVDLDKPWRLWASIAVIGVLGFSIVMGFIVVPVIQGRDAGIDAFTAICRAVGILPGSPAASQPTSTASAQPVTQVAWSADLLRSLQNADLKAGAELAESCVGCHGQRGIAPDPVNPSLAGQSALAIYKQMHDYKSGAREHEVMTGIAQALDDRQILDVISYYASLLKEDLDPTTAEVLDEDIVQLVQRGDSSRDLPPCGSCHGRRAGGPIETPTLTAQNRGYLAQQLRFYRSAQRHNDIYHRMRSVAAKLTDREIDRLAAYYSTLLRE